MFYFDNFFGKKVLKSTLLDGCEHFFTTRDFILHCGTMDEFKDQASENVDFLIDKLNIEKENLYRCKQEHTANVRYAENEENFFDNTDGIVLTRPQSVCFLNFADCIPIILYDKKCNIGSVVHAGWRGTAAKIVQNAVKMMKEKGSEPQNISAAIGAGIGKCCFDVKEDVFYQIIESVGGLEKADKNIYSYCEQSGKYFVDLKLVNKILLNQSSVTSVDVSDYCTSCSNDVFFSYRKENGNTARHSAVLKIKES